MRRIQFIYYKKVKRPSHDPDDFIRIRYIRSELCFYIYLSVRNMPESPQMFNVINKAPALPRLVGTVDSMYSPNCCCHNYKATIYSIYAQRLSA